MRQIGTLSTAQDASRFTAYLLTEGISSHAEDDAGKWVIWVRDEDKLVAARTALVDFQADPAHAKFQGVEQAAEQQRRAEETRREAARQNVITMGQRWNRPVSGKRRPLTLTLVLVCCAIGVITNMGQDRTGPVLSQLLFCNPEHLLSGWQPEGLGNKLIDLRSGQIWRVLTPALVHYGAMHLVFNMVMFYQLGSLIEFRRGSWRLASLILAIALPSNLAQALVPTQWGGSVFFAGLSGVVFGLLGYVWMKSQFEPALGMYINRSSLIMAMIFLALGFVGAFNTGNVRIANWAHGVGFVAGIAVGYAPILWRSLRQA